MFTEILLALFLLTALGMAASSRLLHCIRLAAAQGLLLGLFPLAVWPWGKVSLPFSVLLIAAATLAIKAVLLPTLLRKAMYKAQVKRELEPLVGYASSLLLVLAAATAAFLLSARCLTLPEACPKLAVPTAFTAMFTGLFLIMARRKAITQAIGFLVFENGITAFGMGMMLHYGWIVELGILLDVFVLIFVMGIAVFQIRREFSHIDADQLHQLSDAAPARQEQRP